MSLRDFIKKLKTKLDDGTIREFMDDWKWIFQYSKKYKKFIVLYTMFGICSSTLGLISAVAGKYTIDIIVNHKLNQLWLLILIMVFSTFSSMIFSNVVSRISAKINIMVNNDIQADIFDKVIDADWMRINEYENGDLLNRFNNDVSTVSGNVINWIPDLIIDVYSFITTLAVILYYDVTMALIAFISAPVLLILSRTLMRKMREQRKKMLEMNSKLMSFETEAFYNFDTIKSFGITKLYSKYLRGWQEKYKERNLAYNLFTIKANIGISSISAGVMFVAFGYCLLRLWTNSITYGTMTLFLQQRAQLSSRFDSLVNTIPGMVSSAISAHRIREIVQLPKEVHNPEVAEELRPIADYGFTIEMRNVEFAYKENNKILTGSNFIARPNEIVAIIGPSGEGKTTMLRMILGLVHPAEGNVYLIGNDGRAVDVNADIRPFFSYVPQGNTIISGTIAENLRMVKEEASDEEVIDALKIACAWDFVSKIPDGIEAQLGERGRSISEGQAQRIAIARAVLRNSPILLLDEATSALDVETERNVLRNIIQQRPNKTCIVSTHRPSVLNMCQRVYRVMDKKVTELRDEEADSLVKDW